MNKKSILYILLALVFLIVFNTVFFVVGGAVHPASVWISYGFIHFSYLMVIVTQLLIRKSSSAAVFGFSLHFVSTAYFFLEFIIGLVFVFVRSESYTAALVVQVIIAGIYAAMLISNMIANEYTADSVEQHESEVAYIKNAASRIKLLMGKASDKKANREIERAYDILHSSPSRSIATVSYLEEEINDKVSDLEDAVSADKTEAIIAIAGELVAKTEERNRKLQIAN